MNVLQVDSFDVSLSAVSDSLSASAQATQEANSGHNTSNDTHPIDKNFGHFQIEKLIGRGAFGDVYLGYDPALDRRVAIKTPRFKQSESERVKRFLIEAKSAARLRHPNIVGVFESGEIDGQHFIASEYVESGSLAEKLEQFRPSADKAALWIRDLARALAYAHESHIVHRDIKPDNILVNADGRLQIADFGLAKRTDELSSMTTDGSIIGTPSYMSPEQARGEVDRVGAHSDQYSLGVILYELLTGERPFIGPPHAVVAQVIAADPPTPQSLVNKIPADLAAICLKAIEKNPTRRYADCGALADDLDRWLQGSPVVARPIGPIGRFQRWCVRERKLAMSMGVVAILLFLTAMLGFAFAGLQLRSAGQLRKKQTELEGALAAVQQERQHAVEQTRRVQDAQGELQSALGQARDNLKYAETQRRLAQSNAEKAQQRQLALEQALADAKRQQAEAVKQTEIAGQQRKLATERDRLARLNDYVAEMNQANVALNNGNVSRVREMLERHLPESDKEDFRSFDWYYLASASAGVRREKPRVLRQGEVGTHDNGYEMQISENGQILLIREGGWTMSTVGPSKPAYVTTLFNRRRRQNLPDGDWKLLGSGTAVLGLFSGSTFGEWNVESAQFSQTIDDSAYMRDIAVSRDGNKLAALIPPPSTPRVAAIFDRRTGKTSAISLPAGDMEKYNARRFTSSLFSSDSQRLMIWCSFIRWTFNVETGTSLGVYFGKQRNIHYRSQYKTLLTDDGMWLALVVKPVGSSNFTYLLQPAEDYEADEITANSLVPLPGEGIEFVGRASCDFSPDSKVFAFGGEYVRPLAKSGYNKAPLEFRSTKFDHLAFVITLISRHNSRQRFTASDSDNEQKPPTRGDWDRDSIRQFRGHNGPITALAFSRDSKVLISASVDKTIKVWDVESGIERLTLTDHTAPVTNLVLSADGTVLVSGDANGTVRVWRAPGFSSANE